MAKFVVKSRRITVEGELYTCSISQGMDQNKGPFFRLRQNWAEAWGINLYRPGVVARAIRYYRRKGAQREPQFLCWEPELFSELVDLCFSAEDQKEKESFLQICEQMRAGLES